MNLMGGEEVFHVVINMWDTRCLGVPAWMQPRVAASSIMYETVSQ